MIELITPETVGELERYYRLRWQLLRAPWHQPRGSERDALDTEAVHVMACLHDGRPVGVGRLHFNTPRQAQIRYMAVLRAYQRRGIGRRIVETLEATATEGGAKEIVLEAREGAVGFYEAQGYRPIGAGHTLFGRIQHVKMRKPV